jgi:predicted phage-related endonuclease
MATAARFPDIAPNSDGDEEFRATHVGASEVAALFDASPWLTHYELWHRKAGTIATPDFAGNERMQWGVLLEPVILDEACKRFGWEPVETPRRLSNGKGLGGHPDRFVRRTSDGKIGCVEAKAVDWLQFKKWGDEPQLHYLLQPQTYCGLGGLDWCAITPLVGGNQLECFEYDFRPGLYAEIEARVVAFWQSVRAGDAPTPDFTRDGKTLVEVMGEPTEEVIDLRFDNEADELATAFLSAKAAKADQEALMEEAKNKLLMKIGSAGYAMLPNHRIGANQTKGSPGTLVTQEMVGSTVGARRGWRRFDVKEATA